jgi:hypothetical protein
MSSNTRNMTHGPDNTLMIARGPPSHTTRKRTHGTFTVAQTFTPYYSKHHHLRKSFRQDVKFIHPMEQHWCFNYEHPRWSINKLYIYIYLYIEGKKKEKRTPVFLYRRDFESIGLTLITVFRDVVCGFMSPLGKWALVRHYQSEFVRMGGHVFACCLVFSCLVLGRWRICLS